MSKELRNMRLTSIRRMGESRHRNMGRMVDPYYGDGATLGEVRVTHPLAVIEAVEGSLVDAR